MKHLTLFLFLAFSALAFGQNCVPDIYGNCSDTPFYSQGHVMYDMILLPPTPVWQDSVELDFTIGTFAWSKMGNTRAWTMTALMIDPEDQTFANGSFYPFSPYVSLPWTPLKANAEGKFAITWQPTHEGKAAATLWVIGYFDDDGSNATHAILLIGKGLPAAHR